MLPLPEGHEAAIERRIDALPPSDALLLGEQHDAAEHQRIERQVVASLAARRRLAALAIEMAESGRDTRGLPAGATEAEVRAALHWDEQAWPWSAYGPVVMAAVRAGVPVFGANLPREHMKDALADVSLDVQLRGPALKAQQQAIRIGHCGQLPESQIQPMTRVQIARDRAMAQTVLKARQPGRTVLLVSGAGHAVRALGVPQHLPGDVSLQTVRLSAGGAAPDGDGFDARWPTPPVPERDYCAALRR